MSFCMLTDRYPDTIHKKNQTANPIINAFSIKLNVVHNPKKLLVYDTSGNFKQSLPGRMLC